MRILLVAINYDPEPTGIGPYVGSLARNLAAGGHDVRVLTGVTHYPSWTVQDPFTGWSKHEILGGVPVHRLRHYVPPGGIGPRRALMELSFGIRAVLSGWGNPDLVLSVSPPLATTTLIGLRARLSRRRPTFAVWTQDLYTKGMSELGSAMSWRTRAARVIEGFALRQADAVVTIDEKFRQFVCTELGVDPARTSVHRNWVHLDTALPADDPARIRRELGLGAGPIALHAGSMGKKQGLEHLVDAARLAEARGSDITFVLMGNGSRRAEIERLAQGCANVKVVDPVAQADFTTTLRAADVLLVCELPGVKEMALPSKLTSYFIAGRPVVASVHPEGTSAALVAEAGAGLLVPPGDAEGILDAVTALVADPAISDVYGGSGRLYAHENMLEAAAVAKFDRELVGVRERATGTRAAAVTAPA